MAGVPLVASHDVLNTYAVPKAALLVVGATALLGLLGYIGFVERRLPIPHGRMPTIVAVYALSLFAVTPFAIDPMISLQGSIASQMGLLTWLCYVVVLYAILAVASRDRASFFLLASTVVVTGGIVALIGLAQFVHSVVTDWASVVAGAESVRIHSSIGHPDYAGNFLLFPAFLAIGLSQTTNRVRRAGCWAAAILAAGAIVYTGTRGAWVGVAAGVLVGALAIWRSGLLVAVDWSRTRRAAVILALLVAIGASIVAFTELGAPVRQRASMFAREGFTGAGRTVIWGLTLRMVPAVWATGSGFESFRLAQIPFKTLEFERAMNGVMAEDPHSAYLSHLVATGVLPTALYLLVIGLALSDLIAAIRRSTDRPDTAVGIALLCALVATLVHDLFLHHMLADGLYLFVFLGLSAAWRTCVVDDPHPAIPSPRRHGGPARAAVALLCCLPLVLGLAYAWKIVSADRSMLACIASARAGNDDLTRRFGGRASGATLYQTDYHLLYSAALEQLTERRPDLDVTQRLELAAAEADLARERTLTPVNNLVSAALLKTRIGRFDEAAEDLRRSEAIDPISGLPHLGWSSLFLKRGDIHSAVAHYTEARQRGVLFSRVEGLDANLWAAVNASPDRRSLRRMLRGHSR